MFQSETFKDATPWSHLNFHNQPENFQFAIVSDRTGGHRAGVFEKAVTKLNLLMPEFVVSVGDLIEGYSKDSMEVNRQWDEFNGFIDQLAPPFFYVPGNHDFSNAMMKNQWLERYGRDYYYFVYKDVLFILLNTNDGDGVTFSSDQVSYVKNVLDNHQDVRWTLFFMHHPIWAYEENGKYMEMEKVMGDRPYTVFAGHTHQYLHTVRNNRNHYILGTTGGGSRLNGPRFGEFDHITWVTMADQGPKIINLGLDALYNHDVSNEKTLNLAQHLMKSTQFDHLTFFNPPPGNITNQMANDIFQGGSIKLLISNTSEEALHLDARFFHHHALRPSPDKMDTLIAPKSEFQLNVRLEATAKVALQDLTPLELDWRLGYTTAPNEVPFHLTGSHRFHLLEPPQRIRFTEMPIFLEDHEVEVENPYVGTTLRYTLDGTEPTANASLYNGSIGLDRSAAIKVRVFDSNGAQSGVLEKNYNKVKLHPATGRRKSNPGLKYTYYEGNFKMLPDFNQLEPLSQGQTQFLDVEALAQRENHFAFLFEGYVELPKDGIYTFYIHSDDGAKLFLGDQLVVDNDGSHSARTRSGVMAFKKGKHPIRIEYFEDFLGQTLRLDWEGPGISREEIPADSFSH